MSSYHVITMSDHVILALGEGKKKSKNKNTFYYHLVIKSKKISVSKDV